MLKISIFFSFLFSINVLFANEIISGIEFGVSSKEIKPIANDISNPNSWEETEFEILNPENLSIFGRKPKKSILTFYNGRLYKISSIFDRQNFDSIASDVSSKLGNPDPKDIDLSVKDRYMNFYGEYKDYKYSYIINIYETGNETVFVYTDEKQKDFHFSDLFKGSLIWIIITIAGMFILYLVFGYFVTSYCSNCKSFNLDITGKTFKNPTDYDPSIFGRDIQWDQVYHFKCKKCGHEKDDIYSGYWSWYRNRLE